MFGRRRRIAAALPAPQPELSDEQILGLLQDKLAELVGATGQWTLVPRRSDDTDVIFHDLKANQIARDLTEALRVEKAVLRGELELPLVAARAPESAEPSALSWTPVPIAVWAEPERTPVTAPRASARLVA